MSRAKAVFDSPRSWWTKLSSQMPIGSTALDFWCLSSVSRLRRSSALEVLERADVSALCPAPPSMKH